MSRFVSAEDGAAWVRDGALLFDTRGRLQRMTRPLRGSVAYAWKDWREGAGRTGLLPFDLAPLRVWLSARGLRTDRPVVVAGDGGRGWGEEARLAWTLELLGPHTVGIIDGGAAALRSATAASSPSSVVAGPRAHRCRRDDLARAVQSGEATLWDVRTPDEWAGAQRYGEARGGHLPGATSLPVGELFDARGFLRPRAALEDSLASAGIPLDRPVYAYCTGGIRSALGCAVLTHLGHTAAHNYDGGLWEWSAVPDLPLV